MTRPLLRAVIGILSVVGAIAATLAFIWSPPAAAVDRATVAPFVLLLLTNAGTIIRALFPGGTPLEPKDDR